MVNNIIAFKNACEDFKVRFRDSDDFQMKRMIIEYLVDDERKLMSELEIKFLHSVNYCKVDIGQFEYKNIHCDLSTEWQNFEYHSISRELRIFGYSKKYNHNYLVKITLPTVI